MVRNINYPSKYLLVYKTSWRQTQDMSWRRLQHAFSVTIFVFQDDLKTSWRRLANTSWRRLEDISQDVLKTSWRHVLKTFWRQTKCLLGISVSNHGLLTNLNQYLTNLYLQIYTVLSSKKTQHVWWPHTKTTFYYGLRF